MSDTPRRDRRSRKTKRKNNHDFLVVGIGASAGGITALDNLFERMPSKTGMAFVVIVHLSPEHESSLALLLQRKTDMPVMQVTEPVRVEPNHVYVIPPAKSLVMTDGHLNLLDPDQKRGRRVPIDLFFRTLAEAYGVKSIGVVLSGTGADGTLGLRHIKEAGGVSIAQDPQEAEHDGMPRSAINSGLVDFVLPVAQIPERLVALRHTSERIQTPPETDKPLTETDAEALREVLAILRARTGNDFSNYKRSTILRRLARRLQVNGLENIISYVKVLRERPAEAQDLLRDLIISVTNFFRDADAFKAIEQQIIPGIFEGKSEGDHIRVWVTSCATGEEAYTHAILLLEYAQRLNQFPNIQIFATDIDAESIGEARDGFYPESIAHDITPERLKRFFTKEGHFYRVKKEVRELVLFAPHNILRDPPFSKLDMVSCRNLLIYLNRETQERVLELMHFALKAEGCLFLGSSESADRLPALFVPIDKKQRIFRRRAVASLVPSIPSMPVPGKWEVRLPEVSPATRKAFSFGELHHQLLENYAPPSVLINGDYDIVHLSENAGRYLRFGGGEPTRNLIKVTHPDLRLHLRAALLGATHGKGAAEARLSRFKFEGETHLVNIVARAIDRPETATGFLLVIFEETEPSALTAAEAGAQANSSVAGTDIEPVVRQLEIELERTKDQLRTTIEWHEMSTEELRASNEEFQAINEEMRSASEELETGKEELQSLNEELSTVNHELKEKVDEVNRTNSDLQNLFSATDIGTIFLDRNLRIKRYTPSAQELFNVIPTDINRPLAHITHKLEYKNFPKDAERVLATLTKIEREVRSSEGQWFISQLTPYRTLEDRIDGVVLTFINITKRKQAEIDSRNSQERLRLLMESVEDYAILTTDAKGIIKTWNPGAEKIFGFTESEAIGQHTGMIFTPEDRASGEPEKEIKMALSTGRAEDERWHLRKDGSRFYASGVMSALRDSAVNDCVKVLRDLTSRMQMENDLRRSRDEMEGRVKERTHELELSYEVATAEVAERRAAEARVKDLLRHIVNTQELERRRIARDLHDHLGQRLTALRLSLESLREQARDKQPLNERVEQLQAAAKQIDKEVDFLAWELRPSTLDEFGVAITLGNFVQEWSRHFNIAAQVHVASLAGALLSPQTETNLYRIAQEALNNVYKHAQASSVDVILEQRGNDAVLIVEDNGKGFDPHEELSGNKGLGLVSMRERAALCSGTLEIESAPGEGTTIFARVPLNSAEEEQEKR